MLDEAIFYAGAKRGTSRELRWLEELVTQIGKLDSSLVLIAQLKSKLARMLRDDLPSYEIKVFKMQGDARIIEVYYNEPGDDPDLAEPIDTWTDIPPSHYPFDTLAPSGFTWDISMERFIEKISKLNSLKARKEVPRILTELLSEGNRTEKETSMKEAVADILAADDTLNDKEIQNRLHEQGINCGISYIGNIRRDVETQDDTT
jgi:hypothetical protein